MSGYSEETARNLITRMIKDNQGAPYDQIVRGCQFYDKQINRTVDAMVREGRAVLSDGRLSIPVRRRASRRSR
jgi:hypothetical protein